MSDTVLILFAGSLLIAYILIVGGVVLYLQMKRHDQEMEQLFYKPSAKGGPKTTGLNWKQCKTTGLVKTSNAKDQDHTDIGNCLVGSDIAGNGGQK